MKKVLSVLMVLLLTLGLLPEGISGGNALATAESPCYVVQIAAGG